MTTASTDRELAGMIFVAINRALQAEGYSDSEAFRTALRGDPRPARRVPCR